MFLISKMFSCILSAKNVDCFLFDEQMAPNVHLIEILIITLKF